MKVDLVLRSYVELIAYCSVGVNV